LTRETFPREWASTQNNLPAAYHNRIKGSEADNLEKAIQAYEADCVRAQSCGKASRLKMVSAAMHAWIAASKLSAAVPLRRSW
jgi:hypothetical protein